MKTAGEILLGTVPNECVWTEMDNLTNIPIRYILDAMEKYKDQGVDEIKGKLERIDTLLQKAQLTAAERAKSQYLAEAIRLIHN